MARRITTIIMTALALAAMAGVFYLTNTDNASTWYVRVDDAVAQSKDDGGEEAWEYTLDAYDEGGGHRQLTFTAGKRLSAGRRARWPCLVQVDEPVRTPPPDATCRGGGGALRTRVRRPARGDRRDHRQHRAPRHPQDEPPLEPLPDSDG